MKPRPGRIKNSVDPAPASPRAGWEKAFRAMARRGDDVLLDGETLVLTSWEIEEWIWHETRGK